MVNRFKTAVDLTNESQAKLVKAKSRGLTCTLITDTINTERTWDEIKDLLTLKLCNANIHTYTLCFMDIQQWEKESLVAYVLQSKTEPSDTVLQMMLPLSGFL